MISKRLQAVSASATLAMDAKAKALQAEGKDIVKFGVGEPDYPTPDHIKEAGIKAINDNETRYTANPGIAPLKEAICRKFEDDNGLKFESNQVLVSTGAKQSIFNSLMSLVDPGDEVIIVAPYWVSYPEMVKLAGATPVVVQTDEDTEFKMTPEMLRAALSPRTRAMILNSPSNPTGGVYERKELEALGEVIAEADIWVISDEVYESLIYDGREHFSILTACPQLVNRCVVVNGVSKAYAMTGWRIGYAAAPVELISAMSSVQSHSTSNASSVSQWAALAALEGPKDPIHAMVKEYARRRDYMTERLLNLPGFTTSKPGGAFYIFPNVADLMGTTISGREISDGDALCDLFLEEAHVALVPGTGFGSPENIRFSYSTSMERIEEGFDRLEDLLSR